MELICIWVSFHMMERAFRKMVRNPKMMGKAGLEQRHKEREKFQVVAVYTFNPSIRETEAGRSL